LQRAAGNRAVASLIEHVRGTRQHERQRQVERLPIGRTPDQIARTPNVISHRGRWGDIDSPALLRLWAKEAAMQKLWFGSTVRAIQEDPGSVPKLVDDVLPKLRKALQDPTEFTGSPEARRDADEALTMQWESPGQVKEPVVEQLITRYGRQLTQALAYTPDGSDLVTVPEDFVRIRRHPYGQAFWNGGDIMEKGYIAGNREVLDIKGCGPLKNCGQDPTTDIWYILRRDWSWIYHTTGAVRPFDWHVGRFAREVAESTQMAAELFPLMLKIGGFSLGLSSRLAVIIAAEVLTALGDQGVRSARGERMQSAFEVLTSVGLGVFIAGVTNRIFGRADTASLTGELDTAAELAARKGREEIARTDAALIERELKAGKARAVKDPELAAQGYRLEVDVVSEGQVHTWRQKTGGWWCRFSDDPVCVTNVGHAVEQAAAANPPAFARNLRQAGVSAQARNRLGRDTLSVDDLVTLHPAAPEVSTGWIRVTTPVQRGGAHLPRPSGYEGGITLASEYGVNGYVRYHIRAPGLGRESFPIPLAPEWMNHGANNIETFMRTQRNAGFTVKFNATRATFSGEELRPFFDNLLRNGDAAQLGRLALDRGRVERFLKSITYDIEVSGSRGVTRYRATMETGLPPAGAQQHLIYPTPVR
jgi:hypothetical protein